MSGIIPYHPFHVCGFGTPGTTGDPAYLIDRCGVQKDLHGDPAC